MLIINIFKFVAVTKLYKNITKELSQSDGETVVDALTPVGAMLRTGSV